jgi:hypothetical protein
MAGILKLKSPVWGGGSPKFGIASYRLSGDSIYVECLYENKDGERVYPFRYRIACTKAKTFPKQRVRGGVLLYVIPVEEFEVIG